MFDRRQFLHFASATAGLAVPLFELSSWPAWITEGTFGSFFLEELKKRAHQMAAVAYMPQSRPSSDVLQKIDYEAHGKIKFKTDLALWADGPTNFPSLFSILGDIFKNPSACMWPRKGERTKSSMTTRILICLPILRHANCLTILVSRVFASRKRGMASSIGAKTIGLHSSVDLISVRLASSINMVCRRAVSLSTLQFLTNLRNPRLY